MKVKKTIKTLILIIAFAIFGFDYSTAQPSIEWQKSLGGIGDDWANLIQQTNDGGYIVAGGSYSTDGDVTGNHGYYDYWVVKLNSSGNIDWQKSLGGSGEDWAYSVQQTNDSGYIVAGYSYSTDGDVTGNHGSRDYWVVKLNSSGNLVWQKSIGGSNEDWAKSVRQTNDGGYIVAGYSMSSDGDVTGNHGFSDCWVVKLNPSGNLVWQKSLGGSYMDDANAIKQTNDSGYVVAGWSGSTDGDVTGNHGFDDYWVVKLNSSGNLDWQTSLGGSGDDNAYSIQQTNDGGYIVTGHSPSTDGDVTGNHGYDDFWVAKLNSSGHLEWQKSLGGGNGYDWATSIQQTNDGGYIVTGGSNSTDGDVTGHHDGNDYWVVKLTSSGNIEWQKSLGGSSGDVAQSIQQTSDGGYIVAGYSTSTDGDVTGHHNGYDYWVVKLNPVTGIEKTEKNAEMRIYPNPASEKIIIESPVHAVIEISNMQGQLIKMIVVSDNKTSVDISAFPGEMYIVKMKTEKEIGIKKFIKE